MSIQTDNQALSHQLRYQARIRPQEDRFYALVVYINKNGEEQVCPDFKGAFYKTYLNAERATDKYINKTLSK